MPRTVDPKVVVDPIEVLARQYAKTLAAILRRLRTGALRPDSYLARQIPFILRELGKLDVFAKAWAEQQIQAAYKASAALAQRELISAGVPLIQAGFGGVDAAAMTALVTRTSSNLAAVRTALVEGLLAGEKPTSSKAVAAMRAALDQEGKVQIVGGSLKIRMPKSGHMWDATAYAKVEAKTATYDALRVARRSRYLQNGVDVVVVTSTGTDHDICAVWEGERLSLTGATEGLPTPADARAAGLWHPNCEHSYVVDEKAEQPGGDLSRAPQPNFPTLGQRPPTVRTSPRSRLRARISETLSEA